MTRRLASGSSLLLLLAAVAASAGEHRVGLTLDLVPAPVARSFEAAAFAGFPASPGGDPLTAAPSGARIAFDGMTLSPTLSLREAQAIVLPVPSYKRQLSGEARAAFADHLEHLENLLSDGRRVSGFLAPLPRPAERLRFRARVERLDFHGGRAIRMIGGYARSEKDPPKLAYTLQGLTSDGLFLVTLFWPIEVAGFTPAAEPGESGVALDQIPAESFRPRLDELDAVARSLRIAR